MVSKFREKDQDGIGVSVIVASELAYGVAKSRMVEKNRATLDVFLSGLNVQAMTDKVIWHYADLRCKLEGQGRIIGEYDQWIAAHALASDAILVTNNRKEFDRVDGLRVENWV